MRRRTDIADDSAYWDALSVRLTATIQQRRGAARARGERRERMLWPMGIAAAIALTIVAVRVPPTIIAGSTDAAGRVIAAVDRAPRVAALLYPDARLPTTRPPSVAALLVRP